MKKNIPALNYGEYNIAHIPQQRQTVYLSVHPSTLSIRYSTYMCNLIKSVNVSFWCLFLPPGSQSAFQEELNFTQPWPQPQRKLPGISPPLLMSFFKKKKEEKINTSMPFLQNQTLEQGWEKNERWGGKKEAITCKPGLWTRLFEICLSATTLHKVKLLHSDTWWHFTGPNEWVTTCCETFSFKLRWDVVLTTDIILRLIALWLEP